MAYVYKHIRLDTNEVFYIGIGKNKSRAYSKTHRNEYWHSIVNKAGYSIEIIEDGITWQEAVLKEIELIEYYGRKDKGIGTLVNMTNGGDGAVGLIHSEESKKKRSDSAKGKKRKPHSEEAKKKMSETRKALKGKLQPRSEECKQKLSEIRKALKGKLPLHTEESKRKISESVKQMWNVKKSF
jgi:hypothetical protein